MLVFIGIGIVFGIAIAISDIPISIPGFCDISSIFGTDLQILPTQLPARLHWKADFGTAKSQESRVGL